jgi:hypothetical protein
MSFEKTREMLDQVGLNEAEVLRLARLPEGELFGFRVAKTGAVSVWQALRARTDLSGFYPVVIGESDSPDFLKNIEAEELSAVEILNAAADVTLEDWIARERADDPERLEVEEGDWHEPETEFPEFYVLRKDASTSVVFALVPTTVSSEVPVFLRIGGWNCCPSADVHSAAFRTWHERFGAEIFAVTDDIIECFVKRPPTTRDAARALAWEQYVYCTDIVDQGTQTLNGLAAGLVNNPRWFFWWD